MDAAEVPRGRRDGGVGYASQLIYGERVYLDWRFLDGVLLGRMVDGWFMVVLMHAGALVGVDWAPLLFMCLCVCDNE